MGPGRSAGVGFKPTFCTTEPDTVAQVLLCARTVRSHRLGAGGRSLSPLWGMVETRRQRLQTGPGPKPSRRSSPQAPPGEASSLVRRSTLAQGRPGAERLASPGAITADTAAKVQSQFVSGLRSSGNKAGGAVTAYDVASGEMASSTSGPVSQNVNPQLLELANRAGGLGVKTGPNSVVGTCAEFRSANQLLQEGSSLKDIRFTEVSLPRTGQVKAPCLNCETIFETNLHPGLNWSSVGEGAVWGSAGSSVNAPE